MADQDPNTYVVAHPSKAGFAEGYAAGLQLGEDDVIKVVSDVNCPPDTIYVIDVDSFNRMFNGQE